MIILIIHIIVSYDQNISLIFYVKDRPMSGCNIRLVVTLPPRDSTLQYKRCVHFWNNFLCITSLDVQQIIIWYKLKSCGFLFTSTDLQSFCDKPFQNNVTKSWSRSIQLFRRFLKTNKPDNKQSKKQSLWTYAKCIDVQSTRVLI